MHVFQRETAVLTKTTRITFSMCYLFPHACNFGWKTRRTVPSNEPRRSECHDVSAQESPDPKTITSCHSKSYQVDSLGFKDCKQIHLTKQVSEADQKNPLLHNCQHPTVKNMCFFFNIYVHLVPFDVVLPICQNTSKQYTRTHVILQDRFQLHHPTLEATLGRFRESTLIIS